MAGLVADPIKPQDLGLTVADQQNRVDRGFGDDGQGNWRPILPRYAPPISYLHLYECELFSVSARIDCVVDCGSVDPWSHFEA